MPRRRSTRLYGAAVDLLVKLARRPGGAVPPYDRDLLQREAGLLLEWYCPALGIEVDREGYVEAWDTVFGHAARQEPVTVLRDYHAENLMLVGEAQTLGLLDFQDALVGHPAYDLVSLLQDARRDVAPETEAAMLARYRAATGAGEDFETRITCSARSGTQRSSVSSRGCGVATARRDIRRYARGSGPTGADLASRCWRRSALVRRKHPARIARRSAGAGTMTARWRSAPAGRRGARDRDGDGGRPRQADAPADRDAAQAAGRGRGQAVDRPCIRSARAAGVKRAIVNVHYLADMLEAHLKARERGSRSSSPTSATRLIETGGGLVQARA